VDDWEEQDLLYYFDTAIKYIDEGRKGGNVLVHCQAGRSRSATIVIAYMIHTLKIPSKTATQMLKEVRPIVHPNSAFERQLEIYERWILGVKLPRIHYYGGQISNSPPNKLENSTVDLPEGEGSDVGDAGEEWQPPMGELLFGLEFLLRVDKDYDEPPGVDPTKMLTSHTYYKLMRRERTQPVYLPLGCEADVDVESPNQEYAIQKTLHKGSVSVWVCKNCSRYLFTPLNVIHLGKTSIEIEQMEWMNEIEKIISSSVLCPSCNNVIGEFDQHHIRLKNGNYLGVFKILRKFLNRIDLKIESFPNA